MRLLVVRHAKAFERDPDRFPDDRLRPLTREGAREFRKLARRVGRGIVAPELVLSSSWTRAWDTAVALEDAAGWPAPESCTALESDEPGAVAAIAREISARASLEALALVGHEPAAWCGRRQRCRAARVARRARVDAARIGRARLAVA